MKNFFSTISSQAVLVPNEFAIDHDESSSCDAWNIFIHLNKTISLKNCLNFTSGRSFALPVLTNRSKTLPRDGSWWHLTEFRSNIMNVTLTYKSEIIFYHGPKSEVNPKWTGSGPETNFSYSKFICWIKLNYVWIMFYL